MELIKLYTLNRFQWTFLLLKTVTVLPVHNHVVSELTIPATICINSISFQSSSVIHIGRLYFTLQFWRLKRINSYHRYWWAIIRRWYRFVDGLTNDIAFWTVITNVQQSNKSRKFWTHNWLVLMQWISNSCTTDVRSFSPNHLSVPSNRFGKVGVVLVMFHHLFVIRCPRIPLE